MALDKLLIVDDEKHTREGLRTALEDRFEVFLAPDAAAALAILNSERIDAMLTDLRLGGREDGMSLLEKTLKLPTPPVCIMMTAYGSVDSAVEAMKHGAYDFVTKPLNIDRLEMLLLRALRERHTAAENLNLREQVIERTTNIGDMLGHSPEMEKVFASIRQIAPARVSVLIQGETGTGKELAARAIHALSPRTAAPFVAVHCGAFSPQLLESELFGHEKGAFTGAFERRIGRFEQAAGGTLFLDEIGEIDESTQVKILRVLGEHTFERVGGNKTISTDVRLLAATNKNLTRLVADGKFREDLYFRINVIELTLPPLRNHKQDIPILAAAFLKVACRENNKPLATLVPATLAAMSRYDWPGNVRELRTAIEHAVVMSTSKKILPTDLPASVGTGGSLHPPSALSPTVRSTLLPCAVPQATQQSWALHPPCAAPPENSSLNLQEIKHILVRKALEESGGNRTEAAKRIGISRRTLHRQIKEISAQPH